MSLKKEYGVVSRPLEIFDRLRTAPGRKRLILGAIFRTWRILFPIAAVFRRSVLRSTRFVAVVGTFGKTTTTRAVHSALGQLSGTPRGWNSGAYLALEMFRIRRRERYGVLEVGISRRGTMAGYARLIKPDIAVVTSIGSEHHQSFGTLEKTRDEKAEMVRALSATGLAVLNGDDPNVLWMRDMTKARVITFGFGDACDVRASSIVQDIRNGMRFTLHAGGMSIAMSSRLVGRHMLHALLAGVAAAVGEGLPLDKVLPRLQCVLPVPGRLEVMPLEGGAFLLVDTHKSVMETIVASFHTLAELDANRKLVVLGDIEDPKGSQGPLYRDLGVRLAQFATRVVVVGGKKTYETLAGAARAAGMSREQIVYAGRSARRAAGLVQEDLGAGDIVLIKGRSTQKLERVAFQLAGHAAPCDIDICHLKSRCSHCPLTKRLRRNSKRQQERGG